jgi:hypothetical protein
MQEISSIVGDRKMLIVFDDIDRMQKENIQEFWGTLHNLFAGSDYENIFVIVPFGREQIETIFDSDKSDEYINKTFDIVYRVSLPIISDYTLFFEKKWIEAFGDIADFDQYNRTWQIFDKYSKNITPRNIIAFINEFVTTKQLFGNAIPEEYIALFIMHKDTILKNPQEEIITVSFLGNMETFYKDNEETSKYLAALVFQVEPKKALDVVYKNSLKRMLNKGLTTEIETISNSKIFFHLLIPMLPELEINNAIISLDHVSEKMETDPIQKRRVWNDIFKIVMERMETLKIDYKNALPYQICFIRNISDDQAGKYLSKLLKDICESSLFDSVGYYDIAMKLKEETDKKGFDISVILKSISKEVEPEEYIKLVEEAKDKYSEVNVICSVKKLDDFLTPKVLNNLKALDFVKYLEEKDDLEGVKKCLNELYGLYSSDSSSLPIIINRLKDMDELIDVSKLEPDIIISMYNNALKQKSDFIYDIIAMRLSVPQFQDEDFEDIFINYLKSNEQENELVQKTVKVIQNYVEFGDILINLNEMKNYPLYKNIVNHILKNKSGEKAYIVSLLQKFDTICNDDGIDPQLLIANISEWLQRLKEQEGKYDYSETFSLFFIKEIINLDTEFATYCIGQLKNYLDNLTKDKWKQSMQKKDSYEILITIELDHKSNTFAKEAMNEILSGIAKNDIKPLERTHYEKIINHMLKKGIVFINIFNNVRDVLCGKGELNSTDFLFWGEWLFKYSNLDAKQEVLRTIIPVSLLDNEDCLKIISTNKLYLPNILKAAGNESEGFINGLTARLEKNPESPMLREIAEVLKIKMPNNKAKEEIDSPT